MNILLDVKKEKCHKHRSTDGLRHPPPQETPYWCGEECYHHPLRRDVALHAGGG
jgi:hypothetical protein